MFARRAAACMLRFERGGFMPVKLIALAFVALIAAASAVAQPRPPLSEQNGPTYSNYAIRRMEVEGVRLGMRRDQVIAAMAARGFELTGPNDAGSAFYIRANDQLWVQYLGRVARVARMSYTHIARSPVHPPLTAADRAADRQFLVHLLGEPTSSRVYSERYEEYDYAPRRLTDERSTVLGCYDNWQCQTELYSANCPQVIRRNPKVLVAGMWTEMGPSVDIIDLEAFAASLLNDRHFTERDMRDTGCVTMPID